MAQLSLNEFGQGDASFLAAGGEAGIRKLIDCFYDCMRDNPKYRRIWDWHPHSSDSSNLVDGDDHIKEQSRDKLASFLCGWMGGPKRYQEKFGPIHIPQVHMHLSVTSVERDMWLDCMREALEMQEYSADFKSYLIEQLSRPAEVIRQVCAPKAAE